MLKIKFTNTLSRKKETFRPLAAGRAGLYTCGPTVYNFVHIGNLRTYLFEDILRRTLEYAGYRVRHIMNTTDVDDKTIVASKSAGEKLNEYTKKYEEVFLKDLSLLNIKPPSVLARATEHIPEMIRLIQKLLKNKAAYIKGGSVYFSISKFKQYGKLAHLDIKGLKAGARVDTDEYGKDAAQDFALWKGKKEGEPYWSTPFGEGRPGWHIECSAMSMEYLGATFDIHAGGVDLIFPHHENEIAQSEAATKKLFVRYWLHGEHLLVNGQKMAKSLNNFFTLRDLETRGFNPLAFRYLTLTSHYRSKLNFTWESLGAASHSLNRLYDFEKTTGKDRHRGKTSLKPWVEKFKKAVTDDLNLPKAVAALWNLINAYHKAPEKFDSKKVNLLLRDFNKVLGLGLDEPRFEKIPEVVKKLAQERELLRKAKQWQEADEIRKKIKEHGFTVKDTPEGPQVSILK